MKNNIFDYINPLDNYKFSEMSGNDFLYISYLAFFLDSI